MRKLFTLAFVGLLSLLIAAPASAASVYYSLDLSAAESGLPSGPYGSVTLTQVSDTEIDVSVVLESGYVFAVTGGPHHSFAFTLSDDVKDYASITNLSSGFSSVGAVTNTPWGDFGFGVECTTACENGTKLDNAASLSFSIVVSSGIIDFSDFIGSLKKDILTHYLFSADVGYLATGKTGNVTTAPLPAAFPLMGASLIGLGAIARRKAKKK
ncbi:MAG: VPLPA-CTERM sorting domain-containing protein [Alphaproteobacteria bacterium]|nr:VPLPA-CTERM sorting domain-containing protein [Alphaproteobacteria bacterium]